ncbi:MAG: DUF4271 domain-containing protein [Chitinophagales bacterium]|nr:DUF4271 domain-containing protein [Chitinophagales bacterium]MDW8272638.1 DUF4271 domain-containing protein [Chitinophagales bacterium]
MKKAFVLALIFFYLILQVSAQNSSYTIDTITNASSDSLIHTTAQDSIRSDSLIMKEHDEFASSLFLWQDTIGNEVYDIQQRINEKKGTSPIFWLLTMLIVFVVIKNHFPSEIDELIQTLLSYNRAQQIFRVRAGNFSIASLLLTANFVIVISLFVQAAVKFINPSLNENSNRILYLLIILFTAFILFRTLIVQVLGKIFLMKDLLMFCEYQLLRILQALGISMLPAVLFLYVAEKKMYVIIILAMIVMIFLALAFLFYRWLSTLFKSSAFHIKYIFIYVCCVEVSLTMLFTKLFTKIVS